MTLTLEMPLDNSDLDIVISSSDNEAAQEAAELLETPDDQAESGDAESSEQETAEAAEAATAESAETIQPTAETKPPAAETPAVEPTSMPATPGTTETPKRTTLPPLVVFEMELRDAQNRFTAAAIARLQCEGALKIAKQEEKAALENVRKLIERGPQPLPLFDQGKSASTVEQTKPADSSADTSNTFEQASDSPAIEQPSAATDPDAWRAVSISELGLKPKLTERLEEAGLTTLGKLEDFRAEISQGREKWPKGIGPAKITEIEDAVVGWLSKNRDAAVLAAAAQPGTTAAAEDDQVVAGETATEVAADESSSGDDVPSFDEWDKMPEEERAAYISRLADEINETAETAESLKLDPESETPGAMSYWHSGVEAYGRKSELRHCPYTPGDQMELWIRGWLFAARNDDI